MYKTNKDSGDNGVQAPCRQWVMKSAAQFSAALSMGMINSMLAALFVVPFFGAWLAWKHPLLVLPPAIAYYFFSCDGSERKDGRPWAGFSRDFFIFRLARDYFDFQVYLDPALDASNMTGDDMFVFGLHPHGVTSSYRILLDGVTRENFPKVCHQKQEDSLSMKRAGLSIFFVLLGNFAVFVGLFREKFVMREMSLWSHCIDAGRKTAQYALDKGHSLFIVPGGEHEQILGQHGKEILYLKSRMGFVKLALRNGIPLVPVYVFGASDEFRTSAFLQSVRLTIVRKLRIALPICWGRFGLLIPQEVPLRVVFGAPLSFGKCDKATAVSGQGEASGQKRLRDVSEEELKEAHEAYVVALNNLFDENKARFGYADRELQIL